jgi:hypothetical protein
MMSIGHYKRVCTATLGAGVIFATSVAHGWDETGHVIVTRIAWKALPPEMPDWLRSEEVRGRLEYLSAEPDRWRGQHNVHLDHVNSPDHYLDAETLEDYGLTIMTLPALRREFLDVLATKRARSPDSFDGYDRRRDRDYTRLVPGLLPYAIAELQWKAAASWTTLRTYEEYRRFVTDELVDNARQNVVFHMGILSHFVGDGSQPLHLTHHYNGWVGDNPKGYTTDRGFHRMIDSGVIDHHRLTPEGMTRTDANAVKVTTDGYWKEIGTYLTETNRHVEPLYALEKSGALMGDEGKALIEERLTAAGRMLAGVWAAARDAAVIDDYRVQQLTGGKAKPSGE